MAERHRLRGVEGSHEPKEAENASEEEINQVKGKEEGPCEEEGGQEEVASVSSKATRESRQN